jgi:5-(carboxyamino)imidazole ribonucleotide mutase
MTNPVVGIVMGSQSDWPTLKHAQETLKALGVVAEAKWVTGLEERGFKVVIAGAGMAAALPGVVAARTRLPVLGVPMESKLDGLDSILSMVQMPAGIPVGTLAVGRAGAVNAALLAAAILALSDPKVAAKLTEYRANQSNASETPQDTT